MTDQRFFECPNTMCVNGFTYEYLPVIFTACSSWDKSGCFHDDVIKWKHFPRYWPIVSGIHRSPVNSPHKCQWHGALMFSMICAWTNSWANNGDAGDLRHHRAHYDVMVMLKTIREYWSSFSQNQSIWRLEFPILMVYKVLSKHWIGHYQSLIRPNTHQALAKSSQLAFAVFFQYGRFIFRLCHRLQTDWHRAYRLADSLSFAETSNVYLNYKSMIFTALGLNNFH